VDLGLGVDEVVAHEEGVEDSGYYGCQGEGEVLLGYDFVVGGEETPDGISHG
jgi:hypothetical protein